MSSRLLLRSIFILVFGIVSKIAVAQADSSAFDTASVRIVDPLELQRIQDSLSAAVEASQERINRKLEDKQGRFELLFDFLEEAKAETIAMKQQRKFLRSSRGIIIALIVLIVASILTFLALRVKELRLIAANNDKEEELRGMLERIIPEFIIDDLLHEEEVDPVMWKDCIIVFIELKELAPFEDGDQRLATLDNIFHITENLFKEYGLVKIKTSGQRILAVCKRGRLTPGQQVEATITCVSKLRRALKFMHSPDITMRAGVSYGDVIAALIGTDKLRFDIWGDDVNVAYRNMELAEWNKINVTTYVMRCMNKKKYPVEDLGEIHTKKGQTLKMFSA